MDDEGILNKLKKNIFKILITIIFTVLLLYLIFKKIDLQVTIETFKSINTFTILFPFFLYTLSHFFRGLRCYFILEKQVPFRKMINIVFVHNFFNSVLPLRLGELSYIYLLKKESIEGTKSLFTLGVIRLFDLLSIFIFFSLALLFTTLNNSVFNIFMLISFLIILLVLILVIFFRTIIFNFIKNIHSSTKITFIQKALAKLIETLQHFGVLKSKKNLVYILITSILVWLFALSTGYFIVSPFINISFFVVVIGLCFTMLTYILPIQGFMGFGTTEGAWALVLIFFGFSSELAIATGFIFHVLGLGYASLLGVFGILRIK